MRFEQFFADTDPALIDLLGDDALLDGVSLKVLFEAPWKKPTIGNLRTGLIQPVAICLDSQVTGVGEGTSILHMIEENKDYLVIDVEPDGTGMTALVLRPQT